VVVEKSDAKEFEFKSGAILMKGLKFNHYSIEDTHDKDGKTIKEPHQNTLFKDFTLDI